MHIADNAYKLSLQIAKCFFQKKRVKLYELTSKRFKAFLNANNAIEERVTKNP